MERLDRWNSVHHVKVCLTAPAIIFRHAHKHTVMEVKWNMNGNWLLTASRDHLVKLFDIRNMKEEMQTFKGHKKEATSMIVLIIKFVHAHVHFKMLNGFSSGLITVWVCIA